MDVGIMCFLREAGSLGSFALCLTTTALKLASISELSPKLSDSNIYFPLLNLLMPC